MSATTVLFLPRAEEAYRWLRVEDGAVVARGDGLPDGGAATVAIAPAEAVTLHWAELPARSAAQATTAARLLVAEASAAPAGELHVAVGPAGVAGDRPIGVVATARMRGWMERLAADGVDPDAIVPAALLLPRPDDGYVSADLGGETVVRGTSSGFADEARLTELVTGGIAPTVLARGTVEEAIAAALAATPLDLRQGAFARRRHVTLDWRLVRRLVALALLILLVTLATDLVRIARYSFAADAAEASADHAAREGLPRGESINDAGRQLAARLTALRGPGQGFSRTAAALFAAVRGVSGAEVTGIDFDANGDLRARLAMETEGQVIDVRTRLENAGFAVNAGTFVAAGGRVAGEFTVSPR